MLPYGLWRCADGREVLFNRHYRPIWQRDRVDGYVYPADPDERVPWQRVEYFYGIGTWDKTAAAIAAYERFMGYAWIWDYARADFRGIDERLTVLSKHSLNRRPHDQVEGSRNPEATCRS
jgi:hypothetical protein